jgi:hypothetical protein
MGWPWREYRYRQQRIPLGQSGRRGNQNVRLKHIRFAKKNIAKACHSRSDNFTPPAGQQLVALGEFGHREKETPKPKHIWLAISTLENAFHSKTQQD